MIQGNYFSDNKDIKLHFEKLIDWPEIVEACEQDFKDHAEYKKNNNENLAYAPANTKEALENYLLPLETIGDLAGNHVAPYAAEMDREGLRFENGKVIFPETMCACYKKMQESGLISYGMSRHYGGLHLPVSMEAMIVEVMSRADSSFSIAFGAANIGTIIEHYGTEGLVAEWMPKFVDGTFTSAMALTEPDHGSDLSNITTKAEKDTNGEWRISGTKRFITHACGFNNIPAAIVTLARSGEANSGARGLSLFIVKSTDVEIASIERKLGLHCSPTCEVVYENSPGILLGKPGYGLIKYAMGMMNHARLAIAAQSLGVAQAAVSEAEKYASERKQFGRAIQDIPAVRKILDRMDRELIAMRCLLYEAARSVDIYLWPKHYAIKQNKAFAKVPHSSRISKWEKLANFFTPLTKYYLSEMCNVLAYDSLQIFGGSGYTEDYDIARIYRDARITNIYEGTTQLQIVAAIGGISAGMAPTGYLRNYIEEEMQKFTASSTLKELYQNFEETSAAFRQINDSEVRDILAFEAVEASARFLCSMLLEKSLARLSDTERTDREILIEAFHIDSQAIISADRIRIENVDKQLSRLKTPATKSA